MKTRRTVPQTQAASSHSLHRWTINIHNHVDPQAHSLFLARAFLKLSEKPITIDNLDYNKLVGMLRGSVGLLTFNICCSINYRPTRPPAALELSWFVVCPSGTLVSRTCSATATTPRRCRSCGARDLQPCRWQHGWIGARSSISWWPFTQQR